MQLGKVVDNRKGGQSFFFVITIGAFTSFIAHCRIWSQGEKRDNFSMSKGEKCDNLFIYIRRGGLMGGGV